MKFFLKIYFAYQVRICALVHSLWKKTKGMFCGSGTCRARDRFPKGRPQGGRAKPFHPLFVPQSSRGAVRTEPALSL